MGRRPIHKYMVIFLVLNHYGYVLIGQKMTPENPVFDDLYGILDRLDAYLGHGRSRAEMQAPGMGQYGRKRPGRSEGVFRSFNTKRTAVYWDYDSKINVLY